MLRRAILFAGLAFTVVTPAVADDPPEIRQTFLGDRFDPGELAVPAGVKFALRVENKSTTAMEWESTVLHREKVIPAGGTAVIYIGPLRAGSFEYFDDFHPTIRGNVVAR